MLTRLFTFVGLIALMFFAVFAVDTARAQTEQINSQSAEEASLQFFYSDTCPHCHAEQRFLDQLSKDYPSVEIERYPISNADYHDLLRERAEETGAEQYLGVVPLTFIGDSYIVGFDNPSGTGQEIIGLLEQEFGLPQNKNSTEREDGDNSISLLGLNINLSELSLPVVAITLGILDGFNVCSLGALILILGLVLTLGSRRKIALYGGAFVLTTAVIYGLLILLWHQLFSYLAPHMFWLELTLAAIGIAGGVYFIKEYLRFKRHGVTCESGQSPLINKTTKWVQGLFQNQNSVFTLILAIVAFAAVITIVEFPCSAGVPVMFAGMLAGAGLSAPSYTGLIGLFVLFYLLDELIIFAIAVWRLHIWLASPSFTIWAALIEGLALLSIGAYYALSILNYFL